MLPSPSLIVHPHAMKCRFYSALVAFVLSILFPGCAASSKAFSARGIIREPRVASLMLSRPYKTIARGPLGPQWITLPTGRYFPEMEDAQGVYYFAPGSVWVRDITQIPFPHRGGIYLQIAPAAAIPFLMSSNGLVPWIQDYKRPLDLSRIILEPANGNNRR